MPTSAMSEVYGSPGQEFFFGVGVARPVCGKAEPRRGAGQPEYLHDAMEAGAAVAPAWVGVEA